MKDSSRRPARVAVVGSLNIDFIAKVERLPRPGETIAASSLLQRFGGKGANQAVAAARQGARVALIGCLGTDDHGRAYRRRLRDERIDSGGLSTTERAFTGTALIAVDDSAENMIVVAPGANGRMTASAVRAQAGRISSADVLLLQFEIPMASIVAAVRIANRAGVPVVLNPSPLRNGFPWGECRLDTLIVNTGEAEAIFGWPVKTLGSRLGQWRQAAAEKRVSRVIITRGPRPTLCLSDVDYFEAPAVSVKAVDSVGAGDTFAGAFVVRLAENVELGEAIRYANCAGALATLKAGAQEAMPDRDATEKLAKR
jgi:ribokinase